MKPTIDHATHIETEGEGTAAYRVRALVILMLIYTCSHIDRNILSVVMEPMKQEFGLSDSKLGVLSGIAFGTSFAVMGLLMGYLIDRGNRVRLLATMLAVWSSMTAMCSLAHSYLSLLLLRMGVGAAESGASPASMSLLSDIFPARQRATAIGVYHSSAAISVLVSFGLGGFLAQHYGWRSALLITGIPGLMLVVILLASVREPQRAGEGTEMSPAVRDVFRFIASQRSLVQLLTGMVLAATVTSAMVIWLVSFLVRVHALSLKDAGMIVAVTLGISAGLGTILGGWMTDRLAVSKRGESRPGHRARIAALTIGLTLPFGLLFLHAASIAMATAALALWGLCTVFYLGPSSALVMSLVPSRMRGMTAAILQVLCNFVGVGLGPAALGVLSDRIDGSDSLRYAMSAMLLVALWSAVHFLLAGRHLAGDLDRVKSMETTPDRSSLEDTPGGTGDPGRPAEAPAMP